MISYYPQLYTRLEKQHRSTKIPQSEHQSDFTRHETKRICSGIVSSKHVYQSLTKSPVECKNTDQSRLALLPSPLLFVGLLYQRSQQVGKLLDRWEGRQCTKRRRANRPPQSIIIGYYTLLVLKYCNRNTDAATSLPICTSLDKSRTLQIAASRFISI